MWRAHRSVSLSSLTTLWTHWDYFFPYFLIAMDPVCCLSDTVFTSPSIQLFHSFHIWLFLWTSHKVCIFRKQILFFRADLASQHNWVEGMEIPHIPCAPFLPNTWPPLSASPCRVACVTTDKPTLHIRVTGALGILWCCALYGLDHTSNDMYPSL